MRYFSRKPQKVEIYHYDPDPEFPVGAIRVVAACDGKFRIQEKYSALIGFFWRDWGIGHDHDGNETYLYGEYSKRNEIGFESYEDAESDYRGWHTHVSQKPKAIHV